MLHRGIHELVIRPFRIAEAEFRVWRALLPQQVADTDPMRWMRLTSSSRAGGVLRYSMTRGTSPLLRISASTLRDVPQVGL
jgi:hypothetical protein